VKVRNGTGTGTRAGAEGDGGCCGGVHEAALREMSTAREKRRQAPANALWTEVYRPRGPDEVCGNAPTMMALSRWLSDWKERRNGSGTAGGEGREGGVSADGEWDWEACSDEKGLGSAGGGGLCNMLMLCGPSGVGKTGAVYGCAQALGYEVIEINPSQLRSGAAIRRLFGEAAQSHHVAAGEGKGKEAATCQAAHHAIPEGSLSNLVKGGRQGGGRGKGRGRGRGKGKGKGKGGGASGLAREDQHGDGGGAGGGTRQRPKLTLILLEEVDVVFEEDAGFLGAVKALRAGAKCPVVLTAEAWRDEYVSFDCLVKFMPRARLAEMELCLSAVARAEGLSVSPRALRGLAQYHLGDLRACLMALQAAALGMPRHSRPCPHPRSHSSKEEPTGVCRRDQEACILDISGASEGGSPQGASREEEEVPVNSEGGVGGGDQVAADRNGAGEVLGEHCLAQLLVNGSVSVALGICFDSFLSTVFLGAAAASSAPNPLPCTPELGALASGSMATEPSLSRPPHVAPVGEKEAEPALKLKAPEPSPPALEPRPSRLPFAGRWPAIEGISPAEALVSRPPPSADATTQPGPGKTADSSDPCGGQGGMGSGGVTPAWQGQGQGQEQGAVEFAGAGTRVLIRGSNFAHPLHPRAPGGSAPGDRIEPNPPSAPGPCQQPVAVWFGEKKVEGRVLSDSLVEAWAPPRETPGFVDVVVRVGRGGMLVSNTMLGRR
ncbi:unnamed protein product, partial [Discosporangium mesarthrocarpum]